MSKKNNLSVNKTVTRTYFSNKTGTFITKTYTYKAEKYRETTRSKPKVIVYKNGRINKKKYEEYLSKIPADDFAAQQDFKNLVKKRAQNREKLQETYFEATKESDKVKRMFLNLGYSYEEAAKEIGVDPLEVLNPENWNNKVLSVNGEEYELVWNYNKNVFRRL